LWRIIDANLDRLGEALRVLEDIARFILDDAHLSEKLKNIRHDLIPVDPSTKNKLLAARDTEGDVGHERAAISGSARQSVSDLVTANAKRAEESLRVLEEFAKLPETPAELKGRRFEQARFTLYGIEREITLRLARWDKRERITGLYAIIDAQTLAGRISEAEAARQIIRGGAKVIQLRDKRRSKGELVPIAQELRQICAQAEVLFLINDYVDLALATDADGVHLGQSDLPVCLARRVLPLDKIIGCSVRTVEQAQKAQDEGADYIGVGAIYPSPTKPDAGVIGIEGLRKIRDAILLPIVALGGIKPSNVDEVLEAGANSIAAISAVLSDKIEASTRRLAAKIAGRKANE
jgi:thiamine-phosphate pyrophosphorylase